MEKEYSIVEVALNLFFACIISGLIIATVYYFTNPIAIESAKVVEANTLKVLVPDADAFDKLEDKEGWFEASKSGEPIALVVPVVTEGFSGKIRMLVAVSKEGVVLSYSVVSHTETPGLGDKGDKSPFKEQLVGKTEEGLVVTKDPSETDKIQAITGATITSKAVTKGVSEAVVEAKEHWGL